MSKKKAYYAHSMRKYNSQEEAEELAFIIRHFKGEVICPNKDLGELGGIEPYLKVIETTTAVYATEYNNYVGSGVYEECSFALLKNIPVFVVRKNSNNNFYVSHVICAKKLKTKTLTYYGELITADEKV
jgi:hypothetical protein